MKLLRSQASGDCVALSISMLSGLPYSKVRNRLKKRYGYKLTKGGGVQTIKIGSALEELCPNKIQEVEDGNYNGLACIFKGNKGLFSIQDKESGRSRINGHCIVWNGFMVYDSNCKRPMFQTEYWRYAKQYYGKDITCAYMYKTNLFRRGLSYLFNFFFNWI